MIDFQIVGMPLPKMIGVNDHREVKRFKLKHVANLLDKSKDDDHKGKKKNASNEKVKPT